MNRRTSKNRYLYICESPVLAAYKIGYHTGEQYALYKRYQTALTNKVSFMLFATDHPERNEKILHRILQPYKIDNELFHKSDDLLHLYCYMAKAVTGCDIIKCYSREKYGYLRDKNIWQYQKLETQEEDKINNTINNIIKSGYIITNDIDNQETMDEITESMSNMTINTGRVDDIPVQEFNDMSLNNDSDVMEMVTQDEIDVKYIDNPFGKWAYRGPKCNIYKYRKQQLGLPE